MARPCMQAGIDRHCSSGHSRNPGTAPQVDNSNSTGGTSHHHMKPSYRWSLLPHNHLKVQTPQPSKGPATLQKRPSGGCQQHSENQSHPSASLPVVGVEDRHPQGPCALPLPKLLLSAPTHLSAQCTHAHLCCSVHRCFARRATRIHAAAADGRLQLVARHDQPRGRAR